MPTLNQTRNLIYYFGWFLFTYGRLFTFLCEFWCSGVIMLKMLWRSFYHPHKKQDLVISLHSQYVRRYRPKISCMQFPFVLSSSGIGKDPEMSPERVLLWQWSTLQRLLSYSWLRKLFSTVWCSRWHSHGYFQTQTSCPHGAQLCCCTTLHGIIAMRSLSVLCQQFFCPNLI